jgi:hypothetical protein
VKTITISIHPGDERREDVMVFVRSMFPEIRTFKFRTESDETRPRAVGLGPIGDVGDLMKIDAALFRNFP